MLQATVCDGVAFDTLTFGQDCLGSAKVDVGGREVVDGVRRSKDRYGANVGEAGSGEPGEGRALRARFSDVDLIHELPYGPAACEPPQQRPDTWQHPIPRRSCSKILLAPEGASTHALRAWAGG